ncbi:GIY-YIG nuclease family protein [Streptomyces sp. NPDC088354]|uniref:GIY-YIG nuclease family protein n=1 Tax=Streptomyces sp. NPDC088354 TaxID=3365856 RepID=UPI00381C916F
MTDIVASGLQHIGLIQQREAALAEKRREAEQQFLHSVGAAHRAGELDEGQLHAVFEAYRALGTEHPSVMWDANVDTPWNRMCRLHRYLPNQPDGTWAGEWPTNGESTPESGVAVVYVLYDAANVPCYVGSTSVLRERLARHTNDGKAFVRWQAHPCSTREEAYRHETRLLRQHKPYLNEKASR